MRPLRLAIVTGRFWPLVGGVEKLLGHLAVGLAVRGCRVTILTPRWRAAWPAEIRFHDVPVVRHSPPPGDLWQTLRYLRSLARWLRRNADGYDLVCVSALRHDAYAALGAVGGRVPVVLRAEHAGSRGDCLWQQEATCGRRIGRRCKEAAAVVAATAAAEQELLAAGYPAVRIHCIPKGVSLPPPPTATARAAARASLAEAHAGLGIPAWAPLAVYTGRLQRQKGLRTLLAAWKPVVARWPNARLWLAGDGPERAALAAEIEDLGLSGRVLLIGVFDGVAELLAAADLFVMPSSEGGASLSVLEAMAAGLPLVAADTADQRRWIADGCQGLLVPAEDAGAMSAAIDRLLDQPELAARLGAAARERAAEFSLANMVAQHLTLFERLLAAQENP